jgi:hypothetical protein
MFKDELDFFIANQEELVKKHFGRILVIKGKTIVGVYDTALDAYIETQKEHKLGTFMLQPCERGTEAYTVTINS